MVLTSDSYIYNSETKSNFNTEFIPRVYNSTLLISTALRWELQLLSYSTNSSCNLPSSGSACEHENTANCKKTAPPPPPPFTRKVMSSPCLPALSILGHKFSGQTLIGFSMTQFVTRRLGSTSPAPTKTSASRCTTRLSAPGTYPATLAGPSTSSLTPTTPRSTRPPSRCPSHRKLRSRGRDRGGTPP
jgi:hypothetical protein